jgi:signal transduction histidine kinase
MKEKPKAKSETAQEKEALLLAPGLIHEMRQPLMGIRAGIELLNREAGAQLAPLEGWAIVTAQAERLEELMRGFLELFGAQTATASRFALGPVVERAVTLMRFRLRHLGSRFSAALEGDGALCNGQPAAVLHALTNLIGNGIDAVEETGQTARLAVRLLAPAKGPRQIRVSDEGPGVPAADRERIFTARFTTKGSERGGGLGLHIAREAMARCGGTVRLVDDDDAQRLPWARTEFCIEVPEAT